MNRLRELRNEQKLTLKDLSLVSEKTISGYARYELGNNEPKLATWKKLADFYDVDPEYLVGWSDVKRKNAQ